MLGRFSDASKLFGLSISLDKTKVFYQPALYTNLTVPTIVIDGTELDNVGEFKYLGLTRRLLGQRKRYLDKHIKPSNMKTSNIHSALPAQHSAQDKAESKML